ncbi:mitogen activated protein kinase [Rhizoctonia solani]|uniref:Mitogen-activated protein kinase n=1 Tax=Rhizoctonia solani TaxID=456999 RepID=A0A8H8P7N2_9AGAM|nr:mitogen activated protein kinase [Rhizoctonia solani]QRW25313.1 mitogen activated protein kinase [Rhizoctonia solani]
MYGEPGLESVLLDVDNTLSRVIEALRQWESLSPYQAIVDEGKIATCLEVELRALGECDIHHVLGFEREWAKNYIRAKELDDRDLEEKLLRIAEESPEPAIENPEPMGVQSSVPSTSTAMGRLARDGFTRSRITQRHLDASSSGENFLKGLEALTKEVHDSITTVAQHQPLLNAHQLSPIVAPLMDELLSIRDKPLGEQTDSPMLQVTHVPFVTISDINKMEDAHYLRNIRDLSLQIRLYNKFIPDTDFEEQPPIKKNMGQPWLQFDSANLVRTTKYYINSYRDDYFKRPASGRGGWGCPRSSLFTFKRATSRGLHAGAILLARKEHLESEVVIVFQVRGQPSLEPCNTTRRAKRITMHGTRGTVLYNHKAMFELTSGSPTLIILQIFTHKTPFEGVPMPHGLVAFLVQGPIPNHPSTTLTEYGPILKRKRTPAYTIPATSDDALKAAAIAAAEVLPSEEEGQRVSNELEPVRKELMREVRLWSELSHPNVLEFYGLYDAGGMSIYMISGWMSNGNAPDYLLKCPDANRRDIVSDALKGLCYLHELGILHGDLKGANILIKEDCTACLSDLGLARASHEATITRTLRIPIKTMESDIFAFGLVIRELLGNEIPYSEIQSIPHIIRLIASGSRPSRPKNLIASEWLCDKMWEIVEAALAGNPELRPTACELSQHLSRIPMATRHAPRRRVSEPNPPRPKLRELTYWAYKDSCTMAAQRVTVTALNQQFIIDAEYQFVKELGQGAYGCVLAAKHRRSGEGCAIKKITNIFTKRILTKRCLREIRLLHHFRGHKNITCLYDMDIVFDASGNFNEVYLYEELMEADLHAIIRSGQPLSDAHFQSFLYQTLCGLKYIHSANVLHRDLKPGNLLVNADCELKICDFGLARGYVASGGDARAAAGNQGFMTEYVATRWYRAPEIMLSFATTLLQVVDVWSIGCILAELLGGKPIFKGRDYVDQLNQILHHLGTPSEDTLRRVGSPRALDLLGKLLAFDPAKRISCEQALSHPYLAVWHDPSDEPVCSSTFDFGFEEEDSVEGMRQLIVDEVNAFRHAVARKLVLLGQLEDKIPFLSLRATIYTRDSGRVPSPVVDDPSADLAFEALRHKAREPMAFVPVIASCEVLEENSKYIKRKVALKTGLEMTEDIDLYAPSLITFKSNTGAFVTNLISENAEGERF